MCAWRSSRWTARMIRPMGFHETHEVSSHLATGPMAVCKVFQRHHGGNISLAAVSFWSFEVPVCQKNRFFPCRPKRWSRKAPESTEYVDRVGTRCHHGWRPAAPWMACSWCTDDFPGTWGSSKFAAGDPDGTAAVGREGWMVSFYQLVTTGAPAVVSFVPGVPGKNAFIRSEWCENHTGHTYRIL